MHEYHQGFFHPRNPKKYAGNPEKIVFRSSWEWHMMDEFDRNPSILKWGSEEFHIKYVDPVTGKLRRYFPDFLIEKKTKQNKIVKQLIEVKPIDQCFRPKGSKKISTHNKAWMTYARNLAKWTAAKNFCKKQGMEFIVVCKHPVRGDFMVLTEKEIGF